MLVPGLEFTHRGEGDMADPVVMEDGGRDRNGAVIPAAGRTVLAP
jgi:hypothetical protein